LKTRWNSAGLVSLTRVGKRCEPGHKAKQSDRQPGTALGTTGIDHAPAILGAHARTETVGSLALQVAGLKSSFHG
jgi:hypothetical protein